MSKAKYFNQATRVSKISRVKILEVVKFAKADYDLILIGFPQDRKRDIEIIAIKLGMSYNVKMILKVRDQFTNIAIN